MNDPTACAHAISEAKIVAVVRLENASHILNVAEALLNGGVRAIEITMTTGGALAGIEALARDFPEAIVGAGSVLDAGTAMDAVSAGAVFVVSPVTLPEVVHMAHSCGAAAIPGSFSPTEVFTAMQAGADIVKVFPADVLGPSYIRALRAPMPGLRLMPTGGVTPENAGEWVKAGACAVAIGTALVPPSAVASGDFEEISRRARRTVESVTA
ncbi:MAG: bifunctional 4-hydroxy-2-oxoglutarate aldolase/2-dehydro-3-deoxy-phosphogluconate aldolase [Bacteroidota bacterium]|nr:bifunctional 4-hydroxy-2-oxoglutarate aldolase/2-dehydro-3-deoxy-phosphogluconate aldolase [Bacteroidota bacterium]